MDRILYSVPELTEPWKMTDEELMVVYASLFPCSDPELERLGDHFPQLPPEQLPQCFLADGAFSAGWKTDYGTWKPKKVSSVGNMLGVKTTLDFKPNDGIKADIGHMAVYSTLSPYRDGLFLNESSSLCCVFPKGKGPAADPCNDFVPPPLHEWEEELGTKSEHISVEDYGVALGGPKKRQRGGGGWEGYTKIYTKDTDRMYAACNHCTTMLKLKPNSGTGSQSHHNKSCMLKNLTTIMNSMDTP